MATQSKMIGDGVGLVGGGLGHSWVSRLVGSQGYVEGLGGKWDMQGQVGSARVIVGMGEAGGV